MDDFHEQNPDEICPPPTTAQEVVNCLCDLFLGENWYVTLPLGNDQINTVILDNILFKHCPEYRKKGNKK